MRIVLKKAAFYPLDSRVVHPSGTVLDVSEEDAVVLRERGVVADDEPAPTTPAPEPAPVPEPAREPVRQQRYTPLPEKTAPVARWREWAKQNKVKIPATVRKRAEIMGFLIKAAEG